MEDFNNAGPSFDVIPDNTMCTLQIAIQPGGSGDGGWLTTASTAKGQSDGLALELTVVDGEHAKRKLWTRLTLSGTTEGHQTATEISRFTLRKILESARGIRPEDQSEAAKKARQIENYGELNNLRFVARLAALPPRDGYRAKNTIAEVITPDQQDWRQPEQIGPTINPPVTPSQKPKGGEITRPSWA
jgi:hypothetical protein